nr:MAG TPA: hypothetical protein [Caudoviricetes sp.]
MLHTISFLLPPCFCFVYEYIIYPFSYSVNTFLSTF